MEVAKITMHRIEKSIKVYLRKIIRLTQIALRSINGKYWTK
jgi:hypothetical protein